MKLCTQRKGKHSESFVEQFIETFKRHIVLHSEHINLLPFILIGKFLHNVRSKLKIAQMAAKNDSAFSVNVQALEKAQPKDLDASEIDVRLGAT